MNSKKSVKANPKEEAVLQELMYLSIQGELGKAPPSSADQEEAGRGLRQTRQPHLAAPASHNQTGGRQDRNRAMCRGGR